jgi:UDP-N-acetylglucosamine 2-epimerase (non-hydrolysing)
MIMKNIIFIFGTRPEIIKLAPVILTLKKYPQDYNVIICNTEQQKELSNQTLSYFGLKADINLDSMRENQSLSAVQARILTSLDKVFKDNKIDATIVQGDTMTVFCGALTSFYHKIPVFHVEAGLRSYDIYEPFPEEVMRQMTSRVADLHFAPTTVNKEALLKEDIQENKIHVVGNTVIDALYWVVDKIKRDETLNAELKNILATSGYDINRLNDGKKLVLITGHRRENFGDGFINMCTAIKDLTQKYPNVDFVYPMHLNPNVRKPIHEVFGEDLSNLGNMFFIEPLEYLSFVYLMEKSTIVLTDRGGIQEEAPGLGKPVLVMRDTTERPEALDAGTVKLVGTNYDRIINEVSELIDNQEYYDKMSKAVNPYGDGLACSRICSKLIE